MPTLGHNAGVSGSPCKFDTVRLGLGFRVQGVVFRVLALGCGDMAAGGRPLKREPVCIGGAQFFCFMLAGSKSRERGMLILAF